MASYDDGPILLTGRLAQCREGEAGKSPTAHEAEKTERGTWRPIHYSPAAECWRGERHKDNSGAFNECWFMHVCEQTTQRWVKHHSKGAEGKIPKAHSRSEVVCVTTSQSKNMVTYTGPSIISEWVGRRGQSYP